jgi:pyrimidine operon attenuation protein / uracil phosphoribosyltransferase
MSKGRVIVSEARFALALERICAQLVERYDDFEGTCIIGIQDRGAIFSDRIVTLLEGRGITKFDYGKIDISFHRDDYRRRDRMIAPSETHMEFIIEDKKVLLIDDVLYTGRSVHAAISALQQFGRPSRIELLSLVDRRFNRHFPIKSDFTGVTVDAIDEAYVKVEWQHIDGKDQIKLFSKKESS